MPVNLVVCLKQVPNPDLQFQVAPDGADIRRDALNYRTNGADEVALEAAVRLKEKHGGKVVALTAGPTRAEPILREALAKGADEVVRIAYEEPATFDVGRVARVIATSLRSIPHDLILGGVQSDDMGHSTTMGLIAGLLGVAHASVVTRIEVREGRIEVSCELEGGLERVYELPMPAALTVQYGANIPRYAPLPAIMRASRAPIRSIGPEAAGVASWDTVAGPYEFRVRRLTPPPARGGAEMVGGTTVDQAKHLVRLLRERGFIRG
jgi:electron transfer flavoprotein beta subunit